MTAQSLIRTRLYSRSITQVRQAPRLRLRFRMDLLAARLMLAVGLGIPALMVFQVLSASYLLLGIGFGLIAAGGVLALIRCGEVA